MFPTASRSKTAAVAYLSGRNAFLNRKYRIISLGVLFIWFAGVVVTSAQHELWRDEVRALSLAITPDAFWQLPAMLQNEGHPIVWYLMLRAGFFIFASPVILKVLSLVVGFAAVVIYYRWAPFANWHKILFIFSFLPVYEYAVMARNYGISMLLLFLFVTVCLRTVRKPVVVALFLVVLANTNVHSCIFAGVIALFWFIDDIVIKRKVTGPNRVIEYALALILICIGLLFCLWTTLPTRDSLVTPFTELDTAQFWQAVWSSIRHPGLPLGYVFYGLNVTMRDLLCLVLIAGLMIRPLVALQLYTGLFLFGLFCSVGYAAGRQHQGLMIIYIVMLYWIVYADIPVLIRNRGAHYFQIITKAAVNILLPIIFLVHLAIAAKMIYVDITQSKSSSKDFGEFLNINAQFNDAILIAEPDYLLESLPYYASNRIFIARENVFRDFVRFTRANRQQFSLSELLRCARQVKAGVNENSPVLLLLGHLALADRDPPYEQRYPFQRTFTWSPADLHEFAQATEKLIEFKSAASDEVYEVYRLK
jgi:hypothetical protein